MLLILGVILIVLALLGFGGVLKALRAIAWPMLIAAIVVICLSFYF